MVLLLICFGIIISVFIIGFLNKDSNHENGKIEKIELNFPSVVPIFNSQKGAVEALVDSKTVTLEKLCKLLNKPLVSEPALFCISNDTTNLSRRLALYSIAAVGSGHKFIISFVQTWIGASSMVLSGTDKVLFCSPELMPLWRSGISKISEVTASEMGELSSNIVVRPHDPLVIVSVFTDRAPRPLSPTDVWKTSAVLLSTLHTLSPPSISIQSVLATLSDRPVFVVNVPDVYLE